MTSMQKTWAMETITYWINRRDKHNCPETTKMERNILTILKFLVEDS